MSTETGSFSDGETHESGPDEQANLLLEQAPANQLGEVASGLQKPTDNAIMLNQLPETLRANEYSALAGPTSNNLIRLQESYKSEVSGLPNVLSAVEPGRSELKADDVSNEPSEEDGILPTGNDTLDQLNRVMYIEERLRIEMEEMDQWLNLNLEDEAIERMLGTWQEPKVNTND